MHDLKKENNLKKVKFLISAMNNRSFINKSLKFFSLHYLYFVFGILILISSVASPYFLTVKNIINILLQNSIISIVCLGMLLTIIIQGIDLSVGSVVALAGSLASGFIIGTNYFLVIFMVLILVSLTGLANGVLISYSKINAFIATLAMMTIVRGIAYMYQVGEVRVIYNMKFVNFLAGSIGPIPVPVIIMVVVAIILEIILKRTIFGRNIYAIGGSPEAAYLAGINIKTVIMACYIICSFLAGLAGLILAARLRSGSAVVGSDWALDAIAAVIIGGAPFSGGKGKVINTIIGAFIIGIMNNLLNLIGVASYPQMVVKGVIILLAVMIQRDRK